MPPGVFAAFRAVFAVVIRNSVIQGRAHVNVNTLPFTGSRARGIPCCAGKMAGVTFIPGAREIKDPEAEIERLAALRSGGQEPGTQLIAVRERSAPMSLHLDDADPVAECHVGTCKWHARVDSLFVAVMAWARHLTEQHRHEWE